MAGDDDFDIYGDTSFDAGASGEYSADDDQFNIYNDNSHSRDEDTGKGVSYADDDKGGQDEELEIPETPAIYVGNLSWWTTDQQLEDLLNEFGKVKQLKFFEDKLNGKSKGYAFVEFLNLDAAQQAKSKLSGKEVNGKQVLVNYVSPQNFKSLTGPPGKGITAAPPAMIAQQMGSRPSFSERGGRGGRGGYGESRGGRGGAPFRGGMVAQMPFYQPRGRPFPRGGYPGRGAFYPRGGMMVAPHVNPAFFPFQEDYRYDQDMDDGRHSRKRDRDDDRDYERDRDRDRDRGDRDRDRDYDRDRDHGRDRDRDRDRDDDRRKSSRRDKDRDEDRERR